MSLQPVLERLRTKSHHLTDAGKAAWRELTQPVDSTTTDRLPDAVALEDRILFNTAPVDVGAVLTVFTQTGQNADAPAEGHADAPAEGHAAADMPTGSDGDVALDMPHGSAAVSVDLLADDLYLSVNPEDRIVASYDLGGTYNPDGRNVGYAIDHTGWEVFIAERIEPLLDAGISRVELHTPFGQRSIIIDPVTGQITHPPGQWGFQFDAYLDAQVEAPKLTEDFVSAFQEFFARHEGDGKVDDIIPYIGSPRLDGDQLALTGDPDAWWDRAYDVITPLLEAGFRSIGLDASATATPDTLDYDLHNVLRHPELRDPVRDARLIDIVGDERVEVYLEAMPLRSTGRTDFPLLVLDPDYTRQDPERPGPHLEFRQENFFEHDRLTGEVIRIVRHEQWQSEGHLPVERILLEGDVAAVSALHLTRTSLGGAETLDDYIAQMDLPSLPTHVDLDPDDLNPESAVYEILDGPAHGTLTPNRFHDDVFTYTPNPHFTGVDSFEYVVHDDSGGYATAVVTFFVNTPVVEPQDAIAPLDPPPAAPVPPPAAPPSGDGVNGPVEPPTHSGDTSEPASGGIPFPLDSHEGDAGADPPILDIGGGSEPNAGAPPAPPVPSPPPSGDPALLDPPDQSVDPPVLEPDAGQYTGQDAVPSVSTDPPPPAPLVAVETVQDLASQNAPTTSGTVAPVISPEMATMLSLTEAEESGLFAGATSIELLDAPQGPTFRVQYGFGVLQFLVSTVHDWLPQR